ncbi:MAG: 30S ribosomal protein S16 [Alphaproteobacteria bacterium]
MLKIRLTRAGAKKRPYYKIVVADSRSPRDGRFLERLGSYDPMLPRASGERVKFDAERMKHWISVGAQPSERIQHFLHKAGMGPKPVIHETTKAHLPKKKALERLAAIEAAKAEAAKAAASAETAAPAQAAEAPEAAAQG